MFEKHKTWQHCAALSIRCQPPSKATNRPGEDYALRRAHGPLPRSSQIFWRKKKWRFEMVLRLVLWDMKSKRVAVRLGVHFWNFKEIERRCMNIPCALSKLYCIILDVITNPRWRRRLIREANQVPKSVKSLVAKTRLEKLPDSKEICSAHSLMAGAADLRFRRLPHHPQAGHQPGCSNAIAGSGGWWCGRFSWISRGARSCLSWRHSKPSTDDFEFWCN